MEQALPGNRSGKKDGAEGGRWNPAAVLAVMAILCLWAFHARAEEGQASIPVCSGADGTRAWIEISRTGNRSKAVPSLEVPRETVRGISAAADAGSGLLESAEGEATSTERGRTDIGTFLEQRKSLVIREGPEGVSLGNAFDLVGEIRYAVERGKTRSEKIQALTGVLRHATPDEEAVRKASGNGERPVSELAGERGSDPRFCIRCSSGGS